MLGDPRFCKSLSIKDLHKEGPHSKFHAKLHLALELLLVFSHLLKIFPLPFVSFCIAFGEPLVIASNLLRSNNGERLDFRLRIEQFVVHCAYSLQVGVQGVNNFYAEFHPKIPVPIP